MKKMIRNASLIIGLLVAGLFIVQNLNAKTQDKHQNANLHPVMAYSGTHSIADSKCGEGKCGNDAKEQKTDKSKKSDAKVDKCGEGKCGDGKTKKSKESKCGEGKCGDGKTDKEAKKSKDSKCGNGKCGTN